VTPRRAPRRAVAAVVAAGTLLGCLAGCTQPEAELQTRVDVDTPQLRVLKEEAGIAPCPERTGASAQDGSRLPDVVLPCLGGGADVDLQAVDGPAVVNLWAQWCGPCGKELPLFQRLHERAGDRVEVLGIDWQDTQPGRALELARLSGVTYPLAADPAALVADAWRVNGLPITVFVDRSGRTTVHRGQIADYRDLAHLVAENTGVRLAAG
jgi:thiol-disulfide isomerase/thioredoxin